MTSTKKNLLYNISYQILTLVLPLITVPYVSRKLGAENVGIYSYTYSVVYYFMLISMLGINNYGNRTIAKSRNNKEQLSKNFFGIYIIQFLLSIIMTLLYLVFAYNFEKKYIPVAYVQVIYLISTSIDINWFFFGLEKFKLTVLRNTIIKIVSLACILIFVKNKSSLIIYTCILSVSSLLSNIALLPFLKKEIQKVHISFKDVTKHIKPCIVLFIPVIAISLYKVMDKIMIEKLSNVTEVGYYEQSEKIVSIPLSIITALGTVMLPKISNLVEKDDKERIKLYIEKSVNFMMFLAFPLCYGLIAVADCAVPVILGNEFLKSIQILQALTITTLFISFANILRTQYLIPNERDKDYIISVFLGAIVNLVSNVIFIPKYQALGACIGTILAEFLVMFYQIIVVRKELPIGSYLKQICPFFIKASIMFCVVYCIRLINFSNIIIMFMQICIGASIYILMNIKYINSIIDIKKIIKKFIG